MPLIARGAVALSIAAFLGTQATQGRRVDPSPCLTPSDASAGMLARYQFVDTTTDNLQVTWRQSLGLSSIAVSQITLVSDTTICRRGVTAYNSILSDDRLPA